MLICLGVLPGHAEKRVALVIGNDRYVNLPADQQLRKAVNDARAVGDALGSVGFEVIRGENLGRQALVDKFVELTQRLLPGDTAFFFFSGHGVAINGGNYILPVDVPNAAVGQDMRLAHASFGESDIVSELQGRGVRVAVVVLDACRNNPFKQPGAKGVGAERGLGRIEPVQGVFTLYSAGIGQTALDRLGDADDSPNSVFTRVFVPALTKPGLGLGELAVEVREEVVRLAASVQHNQRPAYYDETIGGQVYLTGLPKEEETSDCPATGCRSCGTGVGDDAEHHQHRGPRRLHQALRRQLLRGPRPRTARRAEKGRRRCAASPSGSAASGNRAGQPHRLERLLFIEGVHRRVEQSWCK
jgi:hypothetical protein